MRLRPWPLLDLSNGADSPVRLPRGRGTLPGFVDAALAVIAAMPTETPPDRHRKSAVIEGGKR